ncbi:MAG: ribbon-helix-helix protein, CopG family [Thermoplasmatota archaeon]
MDNLQVRLPEDDLQALDALAKDLRTSRSDAARAALEEGVRALRLRFALDRYARGGMSLTRAAEHAGVSLHEIAIAARDRGLPYLRHTPEEAADDAKVARAWLRRDRK